MRNIMCGRHPNIWMNMKSAIGISSTTYEHVVDCLVCPLCVKLQKLEIKYLLAKALGERNERLRKRT